MNVKDRKVIPYEEGHKIIEGILYKKCSNCEDWFPCTEEYFYKSNKNKKDGLHASCRECAKEKARINMKNNLDRSKIHCKTYASNPKHRDDITNRIKRFRDKGGLKEWSKNNPEKVKEYTKTRKAKEHTISKKEWESCNDYFDNCCAYCGLPKNQHYFTRNGIAKLGNFHKEHVVHDGGNDISNCVPSCGSCNSKKWKFKLEDWYIETNPIFNQERLDKIYKWLKEDYKLYISD